MFSNYIPSCHYSDWNVVSDGLGSETLSVMSVNVRSIVGKFPELIASLISLKHKFTFIIIIETWLTKEKDKALEIHGYKSCSLYRENQIGGGIKLYYLDNINVCIIDHFTGIFDSCENLSVKAHIPGLGCFYVSCFYRPPNKSLPQFFEYLPNILDTLCDKKCIIVGDFNIDISCESDIVSQYNDCMEPYGFVNEININTYVSPITGLEKSTLDHIWHNLGYECKSHVIRPALSDHYFISCVFNLNIRNIPVKIRFRDFSVRNIDEFKNKMNFEFTKFRPPILNVNIFANYIIEFLNKLLNRYFPIKVREVTDNKLKAPWINRDISACIDKKHKWFKMMKRGLISNNSYKKYCYALRDLLRMAEEDYYKYKLISLSNNPKANWKAINGLLGKKMSGISDHFLIGDCDVYDEFTIANNFNQYFVEYPKDLCDNVSPYLNDYSQIIPLANDLFEFDYCTSNEIKLVISNIKEGGNLDDIPVMFLKMCNALISDILCNLFNRCIDENTYPEIFKLAKITPIFKKGLTYRIENHRPISILCNIGKIFDSIIHDRLTNYFIDGGILSSNQFGFRKDMNTELACIHLVNMILPAFTDSHYCICVFLDFTACFDTISRPILFDKLDRYGVRGTQLDFIKSYFSNRRQYVYYSGVKSGIIKQDIGTLQGSKNGPRFFDIYSNDINFLLNDDQNVLYADDTAIVYVHKDLNILINIVNEKLSLLLDWCNFNKMILNPSKCQYILFTNRHVTIEPVIMLGQEIVERTKSCKYLGMYIDENLKYHDQINHIRSKLRQFRGITFRLNSYFDIKSAKKVYYSMVYSTISYCIVVWGGIFCCTGRGDELQCLHNRIVKNLFSKFFNDNICIFKANSILKLIDIYKMRVAVYIFKVLKLGFYPVLFNDLNFRTNNHLYNTRNIDNLVLPFPRVENIRINYKYMFPHIWNEIPIHIKELGNLRIFKKKLSEFLIDKY